MNEQLRLDIRCIAESIHDLGFSNNTFLITGGTGLIGSTIIKGLLESNRLYNANITIIAAARNKEKLLRVLDEYAADKNLIVILGDIRNKIEHKGTVDYIIHTASVTSSAAMVETPVEVIKTTVLGTMNVLDFAVEHNAKSTVFLSSLEVYGVIDGCETITERDLGYIDISSVRSSYSEGKRISENICVAYAKEYGQNVKIARLAQTVGAQVADNDQRLFVQLAKCVIDNKDVVFHTTGESARNYCYITDAISAILMLLVKGTSGEAYNVANEQTYISAKDLAEMVCSTIAGNKIKLLFDMPKDVSKFGYAPPSKVNMDCSKIHKIGWMPKVNLEDMYLRLIRGMSDNQKQ